jgi:predicted nuclease of predicted toxin-antitoxin system
MADHLQATEAAEVMDRLYADEDFPLPVVEELRRLGHDVVTVQEAGRGNQGIDDAQVLADAGADQRAVLTHNDVDFKHLHRQSTSHYGIISCTQDPTDPTGLAQRIHQAMTAIADLSNQFVRVVRPNRQVKP